MDPLEYLVIEQCLSCLSWDMKGTLPVDELKLLEAPKESPETICFV